MIRETETLSLMSLSWVWKQCKAARKGARKCQLSPYVCSLRCESASVGDPADRKFSVKARALGCGWVCAGREGVGPGTHWRRPSPRHRAEEEGVGRWRATEARRQVGRGHRKGKVRPGQIRLQKRTKSKPVSGSIFKITFTTWCINQKWCTKISGVSLALGLALP